MDLKHLTAEEQGLVQAFAEIARAECPACGWAEIEPVLLSCWNETYRGHSALRWEDLVPFIRAACDQVS